MPPHSPNNPPPGRHWTASLARHHETLSKLVALLVTPVIVLIFFLKFASDVSTAVFQHATSMLSSYDAYWAAMNQNIFAARVGGNYSVYLLARLIERITHVPADPRLHPLRLSAAAVSTLSIWAAAAPVLGDKSGRWNWRTYYAGLLAVACLSFYCYMPYDLPALACLAIMLWLLLRRRYAAALVALLVGGVFRESMLHGVFFALCLLTIAELSPGPWWAAAYLVAYAVQWWLIRRILIPTRTAFNPHVWADLTSLTLWASVAIVFAFTAAALLAVARRVAAAGWSPLDRFFILQVAAVPAWLVFYKLNGGNLSEFRMLTPVVLPLIFACAAAPPPCRSNGEPSR